MAQYRARLQNPEKYGTESTYVTGYRLITSKNIVIRFALEPLTECQFKYLETEPDKSDKVLKESELPASFLEEVDQIYKSQYQGRSQDTSGSGTIKP